MRKILTIITLTFLCACSQKEELVNPDSLFSSQELKDLNYILEKFDNALLTEFKTKSKEEAYSDFSKIVFNQNTIPENIELDDLSKDLPKLSVFNEIWLNISQSKEDQKPNINLDPSKKYFKYLEKLGEESDLIKNYKERVEIINDIQPSVIAGVAKNSDYLNLKNPNYRLFLAIHYLTLINR